MPYIKMENRTQFDPHIKEIADKVTSDGELCYCIYAILVRYCNKFKVHNLFGFSIAANCISALECAKLEFYRRILAPHEDVKIKENGDVV